MASLLAMLRLCAIAILCVSLHACGDGSTFRCTCERTCGWDSKPASTEEVCALSGDWLAARKIADGRCEPKLEPLCGGENAYCICSCTESGSFCEMDEG